MTVSEQAQASARITLRNLIAARWVLIALVSTGVLILALADARVPLGLLPRSEHPAWVMTVLGLWIGLNLASTVALRRDRASEALAGAQLLIDALALTALLALSGGPANPFTLLYFVPITLATQISPRWTWSLAGVCVLGFAALFILVGVEEPQATAPAAPAGIHHEPSMDHEPAMHGAHGAHTPGEAPKSAQASNPGGHATHFEGHQQGMWVAFGIVGVLITVFVHRTALALANQREELSRLRQIALEDRHLTALGTLAAGAAHELGTPLATIKLLVDELPHLEPKESPEALDTVREQLERCKLIVARMASPQLRVSTLGADERWPLTKLAAALDSPELDVPVRVELEPGAAERRSSQPFEAIAQIVRELVHNGADACRQTGEAERGVELRLGANADELHVEVVDEGVGMDAETLAAAFDPFHSSRPEGQGMGMGLYLARAHLRQLGGTIELSSGPGRGTTARVTLPLRGELGG